MTALNKQALRKLAKALSGKEWVAFVHKASGTYAVGSLGHERGEDIIKWPGFDGQDNAESKAKFIATANPSAVLTLLDELEAAENRMAELEAREIKQAKGEVLVVVSGFTGCGKSAIAGEIEIAMKAIGVPVRWTNGDAEKRMTGADWLTAIEMYKPTVRIVEVNVPRAAGIGVKGE
ncbi:ead/Ea22-like family protein [Escherichia coli]|uniref:ead/Ea22-like family protein n=1 Tax=Escherichia coli TaxID=562 RepID=UPI00351C2086